MPQRSVAGTETEFLRLGEFLRREVVTGSGADELFHLLTRTFGASGVVLGEEHGFASWNRAVGIPETWPARYFELQRFDQSVPKLDRAPPGTCYLIDEDAGESKATPLYEAFLKEGFADGAIIRLPTPFRRQVTLCLYRSRPSPAFDATDRARLAMLYPHLVAGLASRSALAALDAPASEKLPDVLRRRAHAWVSFPRLKVEWSESARVLCEERLGALTLAGWVRLERALEQAALRLHTPSVAGRSCWLLSDVRLELAAVPPKAGETERVLLLFFDERPPDDTWAKTPAEELLSERERAVARQLCEGVGAATIAEAFKISRETVREYTRRIYRKLGISSRAELRKLVVQEPSPAPLLPTDER
jgi:DNA-binding CsgD family transcriptional regulator